MNAGEPVVTVAAVLRAAGEWEAHGEEESVCDYLARELAAEPGGQLYAPFVTSDGSDDPLRAEAVAAVQRREASVRDAHRGLDSTT